ncbi:uncharacterized protein LOC131858344 [Cryptomeria japonica]|uniref:uncharacterized protein LOC131858344 n=1 Tax=Cryptomeria japonica TaxID=3369 RepID=UPI0027DA3679|nr:uncharacterized protein LOC131858344 [Cryptomeria japonica]
MTITSSTIPSGLTVELSGSCRTVGVDLIIGSLGTVSVIGMCSAGTTGVLGSSWGGYDISVIRGGFGAGIGICFGGLGFVAVTAGGGIRACGCGCGSCRNPEDWFCHC